MVFHESCLKKYCKEHNLEYPNTGLSIWSCCECQVRKLEPSKNNVKNQRLAVGKECTMPDQFQRLLELAVAKLNKCDSVSKCFKLCGWDSKAENGLFFLA